MREFKNITILPYIDLQPPGCFVPYDYWTKGSALNPRNRSVMEDLNQACADFKRDKNITSIFGTGLNEWKGVKSAHTKKIKELVTEAQMLLDL